MDQEKPLTIKVVLHIERTTPDGSFHCDATPAHGEASWMVTFDQHVQIALCENCIKQVFALAIIE